MQENLRYIAPEKNLHDALLLIDKLGGFGTLFVVGKKNKLLGILGSFEIRQAIISGVSMTTPIKEIMRKNPIVIEENFDEKDIINLFKSSNFVSRKPFDIPIVDCQGRIVKFFSSSDLYRMSMYESDISEKIVFEEKNILILGGAGYIGSVLAEKLLNRGYKVTILDKFLYGEHSVDKFREDSNLKIIKGDTRSIDVLVPAIKNASAVVHLAELVGDPLCARDPDTTFEINYVATSTITRICSDLNVNRYIYISSCSVYGAGPEPNKFLDENSELNPVSIYAKMKINSERAILGVQNEHFCPCILRLGTVFGYSYRQRFDLVVNILTAKALNEGKIDIFGGDQWRPHVSVSDVADVIILAIEQQSEKIKNQVFNVISENMKINDLGKLISDLFPGTKINFTEKVTDIRNYRVSGEKAAEILGFFPKITIKDGILELAQAIKRGEFNDIDSSKYYNIQLCP